MFALLLIVAVILFGFGFLNPIWWMAAAMLLVDSTPYGRDRGRSRSRGGRVRFRRIAGKGSAGPLGPSLQPSVPRALEARGPAGPRTPWVTDEVA